MMADRPRRARWLAVGGIAVLALAALLGGLAWLGRDAHDPPRGASSPPAGPDGLRHLEATVKQVEPGRGSIALAHGLLGLDVTHLRLDRGTAITVGDKEGGIGDLRDGRRVRVTYQVGPQGAIARSIAVLVPERADGSRAQAGAPPAPPVDRAVPREAGPSVGGPRPVEETARPPRPPAPGAAVGAPPDAALHRPADPAPAEGPRARQAPAARPPRATADRAAGAPIASGPVSPESRESDPAAAGLRRPVDEDPDPTAVVDWLLKEYSARRP